MSETIEIVSGGPVEVDTASLERAASGLAAVADDLGLLLDRAAAVRNLAEDAAPFSHAAGVATAVDAARGLRAAGTRAGELAGHLRETAWAYEIVELDNERLLAAAAGDAARESAATTALAAARRAHPEAAGVADLATQAWHLRAAVDAADVIASPLSALDPYAAGMVGLVFAAAVRLVGRGLVPRGAELWGTASPAPPVPTGPAGAPWSGSPTPVPGAGAGVTIAPVSRTTSAAPVSLSAALSRVPEGSDGAARVRVERLAMPDGTAEYVVYTAGTQFLAAPDEAFDARSAAALYFGRDAPSVGAVEAALVASGAEPGDRIDLVGFSQGALVNAWVAQSGTYDVQSVIAAGSPSSVDVGDDVLTVSIEHRDDLVAGLQGSADAGRLGSPDSVVVTRTVDEERGARDVLVPAHRQGPYVHTAELFERSGDPRVAAFDALFDRLGTATSVVATEYSAERAG